MGGAVGDEGFGGRGGCGREEGGGAGEEGVGFRGSGTVGHGLGVEMEVQWDSWMSRAVLAGFVY